jgi:hypothetical protein
MSAGGRVDRMRVYRRRRAAALAAGLVIVAATAYGVAQLGDAAGGGSPDDGTARATGASELLAVEVTGTDQPLLALVGSRRADRPAAFFTVPFDLTMTVPGQGEASTREVASLGGETMRVALSNAFGVWADQYVVLDVDGLAAAVERSGGVRVSVPGAYTTDEGTLAAGSQMLSGPQVAALLRVDDASGEARWAAVLGGLLRSPIRLASGDAASTSDLDGVRRVLHRSAGAALQLFPTTYVAASVLVPKQPDLDRLVGRAFGSARPVPVIVENGVGKPGLGQDVAALLLPAGYRIVVSQNAEPFGYERTKVVANGKGALADARRIREALGVGRVGVSQVPSGVGDITIIVGEDFTG